jgi:hypothetical protein
MDALRKLYEHAGRPIPAALADWEDCVSRWSAAYAEEFTGAELSEINLDCAVFVFDHNFERVTLAFAVSVAQLVERDVGRLRGFPNPTASVRRALGARAFAADRGHFLGHASGGELDINLFPQRRELNRGWSEEGKEFRGMERTSLNILGRSSITDRFTMTKAGSRGCSNTACSKAIHSGG